MKYLLCILLTSILIGSKCKKDNATNFYFQCKVDGVSYEPDNCANCIGKDLLGDTTLILGANTGFKTLGIGIKDNTGIKITSYILNEVNGRRGDYKFSTTSNDRFFTDANHTGVLNITEIDKINKIIAGNFYFDSYNIIQNKVARITEGKFRLNYKIY